MKIAATQAALDFDAINAAALAVYPRLLQRWLPNGRLHGREYKIGNVAGDPGDSLLINVESGVWSDFATDDGGSDPISLFAAINGLGQGEACRQLANELGLANGAAAPLPKAKPSEAWQPILPAPVTAPQNPAHPRLGKPNAVWTYRGADSKVLFFVCRFDQPNGKTIIPLTYSMLNGTKGWHWKHPLPPMPLYGLDRLAWNPDAPVLIVEGEKAADTAQRLLPNVVVITWPRGGKNVDHVDWSPLQGRRCGVWPDNDPPGVEAAEKIAGHLRGIAANVSIFEPPDGVAKGWDLADAEIEGWDADKVVKHMQFNKREANERASVEPLWDNHSPLPPAQPEAPAMPESLLPPVLKPWLNDIAERTQIPLDFIAAPAIVALSSVIGRTVGLYPK